MIVRPLTSVERERVRACLTWCQRDREPEEPDDYTERRLDEARDRWPDVAELTGFSLALPKAGAMVVPKRVTCSHKFVDTSRCVLCGWDPLPR